MGWFFGNNDGDGSKMKVTNDAEVIKTERISSDKPPHTHDIVKVDKVSGTVKAIILGDKAPRKK